MTSKNDLKAGASILPWPDKALPTVKVPAAAQFKNSPKVGVCIPSGRTWEARSATAIAGLCTFSAMNGVSLGIMNLEGSMITKQRNDLVNMAISHKMEYILWIDCDLIMPPDALVRLLKHDKDIVGATYNKRVPPYETLGKLKGAIPDDLASGPLVEADLMPGGFMLVKTSVYEKLGWPWYYETYQWPGENGATAFREMMRHSFCVVPSDDVFDGLDDHPLGKWLDSTHSIERRRNWEYVSEDLQFCTKAQKNGYLLWCDLGITYQLVHLGTHEVTCMPPAEERVIVPAAM